MFLPAWWVRAFEWTTQATLAQRGQGLKNVWSTSQHSGILPALNLHELRGLATVLAAIQQFLVTQPSVASQKQKKIILNPYDHYNNGGFMAPSRLQAYERLLQLLPAVQVQTQSPLALAEDTSPLALTAHPWLRFVETFRWTSDHLRKSEKPIDKDRQEAVSLWERYLRFKNTQSQFSQDETARRSIQLEIELGDFGLELCFGLSDGFVDIIRPGMQSHLDALDHRPFTNTPIAAWHSLWLELTPQEMMLYLKLEKAMQWEFRWIGLDGVFGVKLEDFLGGGSSQSLAQGNEEEERHQEKLSAVERSLGLLKRFGKKLEFHGYLTQLHEMHHRLLDMSGIPMDTAPMILWQASAQRILEDRISEYKHLVRPLLAAPLSGSLKHQWILFLSSQEGSSRRFGSRLWEELCDYGPKVVADLSQTGAFEFYDTSLWSPQALFFEWVMRSHTKSPWPKVPEVIASCPLAPLFQTSDETFGSWRRRFEEFCLLLQDMPEISRIVREEAFASLGAPLTARHPDWQGLYVQQKALSLTQDHKAYSVTSSESPQNKDVSDAQDDQGVGEKENLSPKAPQRELVRHAKGVSMLRTAETELSQLESKNQSQYLELRRAYLGSLDEIGQKLIHDVQARMQPHVFEEHLRKRIIRFMVENPGVWSISKDKLQSKSTR